MGRGITQPSSHFFSYTYEKVIPPCLFLLFLWGSASGAGIARAMPMRHTRRMRQTWKIFNTFKPIELIQWSNVKFLTIWWIFNLNTLSFSILLPSFLRVVRKLWAPVSNWAVVDATLSPPQMPSSAVPEMKKCPGQVEGPARSGAAVTIYAFWERMAGAFYTGLLGGCKGWTDSWKYRFENLA